MVLLALGLISAPPLARADELSDWIAKMPKTGVTLCLANAKLIDPLAAPNGVIICTSPDPVVVSALARIEKMLCALRPTGLPTSPAFAGCTP